MQERFDPSLDDEEEGGIDFARYRIALLRHIWLILGLGTVGLAAGLVISRLVKPVYQAQATIQVGGPRNPAPGPIQQRSLFDARGWIEISRSFEVLDEVVRRRRLFIQPAEATDAAVFAGFSLAERFEPGKYQVESVDGSRLVLRNEAGAELESVAAGDSLGRALGFQWVPTGVTAGRSIKFSVVTPRDAAVALQEDLETIPPPMDGALMRLQMRGTSASEIAATVNAVAERFVEVATRLKREDLTNRTELLKAQLDRSQAELAAADNALESYRIRTITLPSDRGATPIAAGLAATRDPVMEAFFQLKLERESLVNDHEALLRALRMPADSTGELLVALGAIPAVRGTTELTTAIAELGVRRAEARRMSITYTSAHPPLRQLEREIEVLDRDVVRAQARALADNLGLRIKDFDQRIAASSREMQQIPPRVAEEDRRRRAYDIAQSMNSDLTAAYEQARLAELSAAPDVRILDSAVPPNTPVTDQLLLIIVGGLVGGLGLGVVLALLLDRFDHRIRYPDQVTRGLGLQILGALPLVKKERSGAPSADSDAQLTEALRAVRISMRYAHGTAGSFVTTITSPGAGEGKSFLSSHLAHSLAQSGLRTLLIDGDTRRGTLHHALGVSRKPGLLDYLGGNAALEQIVQMIPDKGFDFIPCGTRLAGGPELIASQAMGQMLQQMRTKYQAIIIDSPPLGAGVDPLVLGSLCGSMVLVLRNGVSDRELTEARLGDLHRLPIRLLGAVLNDVKPEGTYRYYAYLPGYRPEDEVEAGAGTTGGKRTSVVPRR